MRSNHWEYIAFVLLALGLALVISGSIIYVTYQQYPQRKTQYNGIQIPLIIAGVCFIVLGVLAFRYIGAGADHPVRFSAGVP